MFPELLIMLFQAIDDAKAMEKLIKNNPVLSKLHAAYKQANAVASKLSPVNHLTKTFNNLYKSLTPQQLKELNASMSDLLSGTLAKRTIKNSLKNIQNSAFKNVYDYSGDNTKLGVDKFGNPIASIDDLPVDIQIQAQSIWVQYVMWVPIFRLPSDWMGILYMKTQTGATEYAYPNVSASQWAKVLDMTEKGHTGSGLWNSGILRHDQKKSLSSFKRNIKKQEINVSEKAQKAIKGAQKALRPQKTKK